MIKEFMKDKLQVNVYETRVELGIDAANKAATVIRELLEKQEVVRIIFAAAPSQNELLENLVKQEGIDWSRVIALHMDEYTGLEKGSDKSFGSFLKNAFFDKVNLGDVYFIDSTTKNIEVECLRYSDILKNNPVDIVLLGIGENGHLAFNDPPVADFDDSKLVKYVELEEKCRQQQVNDGCFKSIDKVPTHAITLTIPSLVNAKYLSVVVPGSTKADAVANTLNNEISSACPASILRTKETATLFIDKDSAAKL